MLTPFYSFVISDRCMIYNPKRCRDVCVQSGYDDGELHIDGEVCPFQYFCNCLCTEFNNQNCIDECAAEGRIPVPGNTCICFTSRSFCRNSSDKKILYRMSNAVVQFLNYSCFSDFVYKIRLTRLGFSSQNQKILYLNSFQSGVITTTPRSQLSMGDTEKLSVTFNHA